MKQILDVACSGQAGRKIGGTMPEKITAYACPHCKKLYRTLRGAQSHEDVCFKSPQQGKVCLTCININHHYHRENRGKNFTPAYCSLTGQKFVSNKTLAKIKNPKFKLHDDSTLTMAGLGDLRPYPANCPHKKER